MNKTWRAETKESIKKDTGLTGQWQLWFVPMPTEKSTDRGLGENSFDFANYHNCNINQVETQLLPYLCSSLILFNLAIYLGWGERVQAGMHVLERSDGDAGKQPWCAQSCFQEKGWEHQDQALLHSQIRALGIQPYPVTQLGCWSASECCRSRLCFLCRLWLSFFNTQIKQKIHAKYPTIPHLMLGCSSMGKYLTTNTRTAYLSLQLCTSTTSMAKTQVIICESTHFSA